MTLAARTILPRKRFANLPKKFTMAKWAPSAKITRVCSRILGQGLARCFRCSKRPTRGSREIQRRSHTTTAPPFALSLPAILAPPPLVTSPCNSTPRARIPNPRLPESSLSIQRIPPTNFFRYHVSTHSQHPSCVADSAERGESGKDRTLDGDDANRSVLSRRTTRTTPSPSLVRKST
ncbi:hypothetical protein B0H63DRAFT_480781 [Podospora didyma]|uniref:Uncharacterized protein n=1 Tax=Podospora didyma TaxID=330526 RepID=A0AAE0KEH5_9PEZI|nr:hypothetical protein B0H63DRAFT_480781 [Podospora didyma]